MKAILTWVALAILFIIPVWVTGIFLAPGLVGALQWVGLNWLATLAANILALGALLFFILAAISARGEYKFREHVRDIAPWAITVFIIVLVIQALRG